MAAIFVVFRMIKISPSPSTLIAGSKRKRETTGSPQLPEQPVYSPRKRPNLTLAITIPSLADLTAHDVDDDTTSPISGLSDPDSLFDEQSPLTSSDTLPTICDHPHSPAILTAPCIRGLFFTPAVRLPEELAASVIQYCLQEYFQHESVNQVMLFGRFVIPNSPSSEGTGSTGLPPVLLQLLSHLEEMLFPIVPPETHELLFPRVPSRARQAILNLYQPGEGIIPHVDLLRRFGDGIIGVSFGSGCVMQFARAAEEAGGHHEPAVDAVEHEKNNWDVYLPERSVIVLSEDARYKWTHGIAKHTQDYVALPDTGTDDTAGEWIQRGVRLSITFRWLLPGADVVGDEPTSP
ncbi:hypothetical protein DXG01_001633 [Tephrocybe rancida]|nr:hypothetical protein DXG01_001633 [Tephrocybe rancida]